FMELGSGSGPGVPLVSDRGLGSNAIGKELETINSPPRDIGLNPGYKGLVPNPSTAAPNLTMNRFGFGSFDNSSNNSTSGNNPSGSFGRFIEQQQDAGLVLNGNSLFNSSQVPLFAQNSAQVYPENNPVPGSWNSYLNNSLNSNLASQMMMYQFFPQNPQLSMFVQNAFSGQKVADFPQAGSTFAGQGGFPIGSQPKMNFQAENKGNDPQVENMGQSSDQFIKDVAFNKRIMKTEINQGDISGLNTGSRLNFNTSGTEI
ncbi:hypothetical protein BB560_004903, partial [Smittium megazygosporum]